MDVHNKHKSKPIIFDIYNPLLPKNIVFKISYKFLFYRFVIKYFENKTKS